MPKGSGTIATSTLLLAAAVVIAVYFYTQNYDGFQTDASGNTAGTASMDKKSEVTFNFGDIPWWGKTLIILAIVLAVGLGIWAFVLQTKGTYKALSGVGEGVRNIGSGIKSGLSGWGNKQRANASRSS